MGWIDQWKFGCLRGNQSGIASLIVVLCVCILIQMLGLPVTFLSLLDSDDLLKSQPGAEDFSAPSQVLYPDRPGQVTGTVQVPAMLVLLVLPRTFFHPPAA